MAPTSCESTDHISLGFQKMPGNASRNTITALVLLVTLGCTVWATDHTFNSHTFKYSSYFDHENLALQHVLELPEQKWKPFSDNHYQVSLTNDEFWELDAYPILWVKIEIPKRIKKEQLLLEVVPNTGVDGLLVQNIQDRWQWISAEGRQLDDPNSLPTTYLTFSIDPTTETKIAYLKLNTSQVYNFSINVYEPSAWVWETLTRHLLIGMVLGAMMLAFCYNLAIGINAGERLYLIYAAYVASMFFYTIVYQGYLRVYFPDWGGQGVVARSAVYIVIYAALAFAREFFNLREEHGRLDKVTQFTQASIIIALLISLFVNDFYAFVINDTLSIFSILIGFFAGFHGLKRGHPLAKLFLFAWSCFLVGSLAWTFVWIGLVQPTTLATNMLVIGTAIEIGLLSLILSYRYSFFKETSESLSEQYKKYQSLSETDELTGINNRRGFLKAVEKEINKTPHELVWLALDIDHFKVFNDKYGHLAGDRLLAAFGALLKSRTQREELTSKLVIERSGEVYRRSIVGRMGGEEFSILLVNTSLSQAKLYVDRLMKEFSELSVTNDRGEIISTTLSIGGTPVNENDSIDQAWKRADARLYEAKTAGRNCAIVTP